MKGIFKSDIHASQELSRDTMRWSSLLDDLVIRDKVDFRRSTGLERVTRRLCGIELALGPVTSEETFHLANWKAAEAVELPIEETARYS